MSLKRTVLPDDANIFSDIRFEQFKYKEDDFEGLPVSEELIGRFSEIVMPLNFEVYYGDIKNLKVYSDDVWVLNYPKSEASCLLEIIWQVCNGVNIPDTKEKSLEERFPLLEAIHQLDDLCNIPRPRFITSYLPLCFLPKEIWIVKPKIIYFTKEPKEVAVSYFYHYSYEMLYFSSINQFLECFLLGWVQYGSYWDHIEQYYLLQQYYQRMDILSYENIKRDLKSTILQISSFYYKFLSKKELKILLHYMENDFKNQQIKDENKYLESLRRDHVEYLWGWRDHMSENYIDKFDETTRVKFKELGIYRRLRF